MAIQPSPLTVQGRARIPAPGRRDDRQRAPGGGAGQLRRARDITSACHGVPL